MASHGIARNYDPIVKLIVFASRFPSRLLRLGDSGSGAWRLGDLEASFLGVLGRSFAWLVARSIGCSFGRLLGRLTAHLVAQSIACPSGRVTNRPFDNQTMEGGMVKQGCHKARFGNHPNRVFSRGGRRKAGIRERPRRGVRGEVNLSPVTRFRKLDSWIV